jgi:hypothetical protein
VTRQAKQPARAGQRKQSRARNAKQIPVSFGAYPEELERWKKAAEEADRPLAWWIRSRLLAMDARDDQRPLFPEEETVAAPASETAAR